MPHRAWPSLSEISRHRSGHGATKRRPQRIPTTVRCPGAGPGADQVGLESRVRLPACASLTEDRRIEQCSPARCRQPARSRRPDRRGRVAPMGSRTSRLRACRRGPVNPRTGRQRCPPEDDRALVPDWNPWSYDLRAVMLAVRARVGWCGSIARSVGCRWRLRSRRHRYSVRVSAGQDSGEPYSTPAGG